MKIPNSEVSRGGSALKRTFVVTPSTCLKKVSFLALSAPAGCSSIAAGLAGSYSKQNRILIGQFFLLRLSKGREDDETRILTTTEKPGSKSRDGIYSARDVSDLE